MKKYIHVTLSLCVFCTLQYDAWAMDQQSDGYSSDGERLDLHQKHKFSFNPMDLQRAKDGDKNLIGVNLEGANLSRVDLSGTDLTGARLNRANLFMARLCGANLTNANLSDAIFLYTDLRGATLHNTILGHSINPEAQTAQRIQSSEDFFDFYNSDLSGAKIKNVAFNQVNIKNTKFIDSVIEDTLFFNLKIKNSDFTNSKMFRVNVARTIMDTVKMRHVMIDEIIICALSELNNIDLTLAQINKINIQDCPVIGDGLKLNYATISTGQIKGGVILSGIFGPAKKQDHPIASGLGERLGFDVGLLPGALMMLSLAGIPLVGIPLGIGVMLGGAFGGAYTGRNVSTHLSQKIDEVRGRYNISNIGSILLNSNFHGTKMSDLCMSNIQFRNCINIQHIKMATGCLLENVTSSNPMDLIAFMNKGAKVNDSYSPIFEYEWKYTNYDGFLNQLRRDVIPTFARGVLEGILTSQSTR